MLWMLGLGGELKYQMEPLRNLYEGIFTKTFTLFYGETLHYYFKAELGEKICADSGACDHHGQG